MWGIQNNCREETYDELPSHALRSFPAKATHMRVRERHNGYLSSFIYPVTSILDGFFFCKFKYPSAVAEL